QGVLSRLLFRRAPQLSGCEVLSAPQAVALKYFDKLETRSAKVRESALMAVLPKLLAHAKKHAPGFSRILKDVNPAKIKSRAALASLPITRKSELAAIQKALPPL